MAELDSLLPLAYHLRRQILNAETVEDHAAVKQHFKGLAAIIRSRGGKKQFGKSPFGFFLMTAVTTYYNF